MSARSENSFDTTTRTWTLRTHAAVSEALADAALTADDPSTSRPVDNAHAAIRVAARHHFSATKRSDWRDSVAASATALVVEAVRHGVSVELMQAVAEPFSLQLAADVAGLTLADASQCNGLARAIFLDAARMNALAGRSDDASAVSLAAALARPTGGTALDVQSFVAISQTLPHLLVAIWHALFAHRDQAAIWRSAIDRSNAIDELLRFAGPSRAVFRRARGDTRCADAIIETGQNVTIMLGDANFDSTVFAEPDHLDLDRDNAAQHLALGGGRHPCVGAPIIRLAVEVATNVLLTHVADDTLVVEEVRWLDGFAIRAPSSLTVHLC